MIRSYKFRIYPNKKQEHQFYKEFAASKFVYNYYLDKSIKYYEENKNNDKKKSINYYDWCKDLTSMKKEENNKWLKEASNVVLQQKLRDLNLAYKNFFRRLGQGTNPGFPNFKKFNSSVRYSNISCKYSRKIHKIKISKIGWIRIVDYSPAYGKIMNMTISKSKDGKWYVSISVEQKDKILIDNKSEKQIGIDVGIKSFLVDSDGNKINNPKFLEKSEKKLMKAQKELSKKKIGSNNRRKQRLVLAKIHAKITDQRKNFLHQLSIKLTKENTLIVRENLAIKNMVKNHKLAKSISSVSWSEFFSMLDYKGIWYGCEIMKIGRFEPSSKKCNNCGYVKKDLTLDIREWECPNCHEILNRDINAAKNILEIGLQNF